MVKNWLRSADTLATLNIYKKLGAKIDDRGQELLIKGEGLFSFKEPKDILNAQNSGTTTRLTLGVLAAQPFFAVLTGDESLRRRPMLRVTQPLREMGAFIDGREGGNLLPLAVRGGEVKGYFLFQQEGFGPS